MGASKGSKTKILLEAFLLLHMVCRMCCQWYLAFPLPFVSLLEREKRTVAADTHVVLCWTHPPDRNGNPPPPPPPPPNRCLNRRRIFWCVVVNVKLLNAYFGQCLQISYNFFSHSLQRNFGAILLDLEMCWSIKSRRIIVLAALMGLDL